MTTRDGELTAQLDAWLSLAETVEYEMIELCEEHYDPEAHDDWWNLYDDIDYDGSAHMTVDNVVAYHAPRALVGLAQIIDAMPADMVEAGQQFSDDIGGPDPDKGVEHALQTILFGALQQVAYDTAEAWHDKQKGATNA